MAGRLRISRLPSVVDRYRKWDIVVDGAVAGHVANGRAADVRVEAGDHTVRVGHRFLASPERTFVVKGTQTVQFVCRPRPHPVIWIPYGVASLLRRNLFIILEPFPEQASEVDQPVRRARPVRSPSKARLPRRAGPEIQTMSS